MRSGWFTAGEARAALLITGVIGALLAAAWPKVRERRDAARCLSNLEGWAAALHAYAADHDGQTPRRGQGRRPLSKIERPEDWFNALPPYAGLPSYSALVKSGRRIEPGEGTLFACPRARDPGAECFLPYAMNMNLSPSDRPAPHRLAEIANASRLVFLADGPGPYSATLPAAAPYSVPARHGGRVHLVFVDGHAASFDGAHVGAGVGDPHREEIQWALPDTGTD